MSNKILISSVTLTALLVAAQHGLALAKTEAATISQDADDKADLNAKLAAANSSVASLQAEITELETESGDPVDADLQAQIDGVVAADPGAPAVTAAPAPNPDPTAGAGNGGSSPGDGTAPATGDGSGSGVAMAPGASAS